MAQAPTRTVKDPEVRREEILDAAQALFTQKGYDATSIQDIIQAVGIAKGTFYHYFRSKLELLDAVIERLLVAMTGELEAMAADSTLDAAGKFRRIFFQANLYKLQQQALIREVARVMYRPENAVFRERLARASLETVAPVLARVIRQGCREETFQVEDPEEVAYLLLYMGQALGDAIARTMLAANAQDLDRDRVMRKARAYERAVERILGAEPGSLQLLPPEMLTAWLPD